MDWSRLFGIHLAINRSEPGERSEASDKQANRVVIAFFLTQKQVLTTLHPMKLEPLLRLLTLLILPLGSSLSIDMYLPAYADIAREYFITEGWVNLSMGIYLFGIALGQLIYGPISDKYGRRTPLLIGLVIFLLATLGCQLSKNYLSFMVCRLLQALGACSAIVLVRAIIMDRYTEQRQLRLLALVAAINIFSPALAPLLGGIMLQWVNWHMIFATISGYAFLTLVLTYCFIPETNSEFDQDALCIKMIKQHGVEIVTHHLYFRYTACIALLYGVAFVWVTLSPIIVIHDMHVSQAHFGMVFMMQCLGNTSGALLAALFTSQAASQRFLTWGFMIFMFSCLLFAGCTLLMTITLPVLLVFVVVIYFAVGVVQPCLIQAAIKQFPHHRGYAAGLLGAMQTGFGMLTTLITGYFYEYSLITMSVMLIFFSILSVLVLPRKPNVCSYQKMWSFYI